MKNWIHCQGYFSERPNYGPFWIAVDDGLIVEITRTEPESSSISSCEYLLPLLSDTHVHCYMNPWPLSPKDRIKPGSGAFEDEVASGMERLNEALLMGVGHLRDMGDPLGVNLEIRKRVSERDNSFPSLQVVGPAIHRPKKYGRYLGVKRESIEEILELVEKLAIVDKIDVLKIVSTGIVNFSKQAMNQSPQFTVDELTMVVDHAEKFNLKVASHCSGSDGIELNLAAGIQFIEHAYFVQEDQIPRFAEGGHFWTPTFAPVYQQATNAACGWDGQSTRSMYQILDRHNDAITKGYNAGVQILVGTDSGSPGVEIGSGLILEMRSLSWSIPLIEVLRMVTSGNADALQSPKYTGRIEVGHRASFASYKNAPWQDFSQLGRPEVVWQSGNIVTSN